MNQARRLLLASGLMLFLELALIRWLGSNVLHLSYFTNFVLLGSFLGIGLGFLLARRGVEPLWISLAAVMMLVLVVTNIPVRVNRTSSEVIYFTSTVTTGPPAWVTLPLIFLAVAAALLGPAAAVGRCFSSFAPLDAYRLDLIGSLCGIASFTAMSYLRAPSVVWGAVVVAAFVVLIPRKQWLYTALPAMALLLLLGIESTATGVSWSPYYKVKTDALATSDGSKALRISVNGVPHQELRSAASRLTQEPQHGLPYQRLEGNRLDDVLIIGAGSGSDVAIALRMNAKHVDAVEIDPRILQIGQEEYPDRPYSDPRVTAHVDDGRAFLERSDKKYDLILFALPDSLVLVSGASAIRLESYLFTIEAVQSARDHLRPGGGVAMYNYYREDRLIDRLGGTVEDAFGHYPCIDRVGGGQAVISAGLSLGDQTCAYDQPSLSEARTAPATDDRPFVYFFGSTLPALYLLTLGVILAVSLLSVRVLGGPLRTMRPYLDLFFMGAAFLLLETKNITTFALLFGTTWVVNAIVFAGVLVAVLLAVETTRRFRTPPPRVVYAAIAVSLVIAWLIPNSALLGLPLLLRIVAAVAVAFAPIYLANVAFAQRFAATGDSQAAFAINILGAMVGGCLEYLALLTGYRNLLVLAGLLYLVAFLLTPRTKAAVTA